MDLAQKFWATFLAGFGDKNTAKKCGAPERIRTTNLLIRTSVPTEDDIRTEIVRSYSTIATSANRRLQFQKCGYLFNRAYNETFPVIAICVSNEECSPAAIDSCELAPTPTGFAEIVSDYLPVSFHGCFSSQSF
jgi:hypothetical protein